MSLAGFKPKIPASVRLQTYNLDRVTTGISHLIFKVLKKLPSKNYKTSKNFMEKLLDYIWNIKVNLMHNKCAAKDKCT
jgi:hypothetical protein